MMPRIIQIALCCVFILFFSNTISAQTKCKVIKKIKISYDINKPEEFSKRIKILQVCGYDSIDCDIAAMLTSSLLLVGMSGNSKPEVSLAEVIDLLELYKKGPLYTEARKKAIEGKKANPKTEKPQLIDYSSLCDIPLLKDTFDSFCNLPQYFIIIRHSDAPG